MLRMEATLDPMLYDSKQPSDIGPTLASVAIIGLCGRTVAVLETFIYKTRSFIEQSTHWVSVVSD